MSIDAMRITPAPAESETAGVPLLAPAAPRGRADVPLDAPPPGGPPPRDPVEEPVDLDRLGDEIAELAAHLDAATARLLTRLREFDARGGWTTGFRSCAEWLSWRAGLELGAAREKVRVARALGGLPRLAAALARGVVSYSKVRALTRVATPETEAELLEVARAGTASHVLKRRGGWAATPRGW